MKRVPADESGHLVLSTCTHAHQRSVRFTPLKAGDAAWCHHTRQRSIFLSQLTTAGHTDWCHHTRQRSTRFTQPCGQPMRLPTELDHLSGAHRLNLNALNDESTRTQSAGSSVSISSMQMTHVGLRTIAAIAAAHPKYTSKCKCCSSYRLTYASGMCRL